MTPIQMPQPDSDSHADRLVKVAELRYGEHLSRKEVTARLAADLGRTLSETNVTHWLNEARELGVVAVDIDPSFAIAGKPNPRVSEQLMRAFGLDEAIVIDVNPNDQNDTRAARLHTALANQTGKRFVEILSSRTAVFVAGGRTIIQIARRISRMRPTKMNIRIDPLSGRNWTGCWQVDGQDDLERPLDADDVAVILASALPKSGTRFSQIGHPLYAQTSQQARSIMRENCAFLPDGLWNWDISRRLVKRAICGVGSLHPLSGHRIMRFLEAYLNTYGVHSAEDLDRMICENALSRISLPEEPAESAPYLSRVAVDLIAAIAFATENGLGYFADIANRLYPCLPMPNQFVGGETRSLENYVGLRERLDVLNQRGIVAQWAHLRDASAWVTAGGALKLPAIWTLAIARYVEQSHHSAGNPQESIMGQLTTDSVTAHRLLEGFHAFQRATNKIQQCYFDLARVIFPTDSNGSV